MQNLNLFRVEGSNFFHLRPPKACRDKNRLGLRFCRRVKFRENNSCTALYCSVSMMNHSCEPNVMNSFYKNKIVVRAIRLLV